MPNSAPICDPDKLAISDIQSEMDDQERKSRLHILHIVLVLSLVANGLGAFSNLMMSLTAMRDFMQANIQLLPEVLHETYEMMLSLPSSYYIASALLSAMAFIGCMRMWKLKGMGFHYYTLSKLMLIATPLVFIGRQYLNIGDVMMTLLFVAFYYVSLRTLDAFDKNEPCDNDSPTDQTSPTDDNPPLG